MQCIRGGDSSLLPDKNMVCIGYVQQWLHVKILTLSFNSWTKIESSKMSGIIKSEERAARLFMGKVSTGDPQRNLNGGPSSSYFGGPLFLTLKRKLVRSNCTLSVIWLFTIDYQMPVFSRPQFAKALVENVSLELNFLQICISRSLGNIKLLLE